ncbi:MAG: glycosyltransferase family A protein [Pirellulales bacterium]
MHPPENSCPLISVAIATYNRAETLRRALSSISRLHHDQFQIEVVVIDNGSSDHTRDVVAAVAESCPFPITSFYEAQAGLPFARNRAVKESRGQWIAFFDDDQLTDPQWLVKLYRTAVREQVLCVGGSRSLLLESNTTVELPSYCRELLGEINQQESGDYHILNLPCTGNVLIHRSLFEQWGMFDERVLDGGEDSDFFNRLLHGGVRCVYEPSAAVQHLIPATRLESDYLQRIAFRHGIHVCRRDLQYRGKWATYLSAAARVLLVGISAPCKIACASLVARRNEVISHYCKWRRACGYLSYAIKNQSGQKDLSSRTMHRGR